METNTAARIPPISIQFMSRRFRRMFTAHASSDFVRAEPALDGVRYHIPADAFFSLAGYAGGYKAFVHVKYKLRYVFRLFSVSKIYSAEMRNIINA